MPLAFPSHSHGTIAFGFFNLECDMLLLENLFFFAHEFSSVVPALLFPKTFAGPAGPIPGWRISSREDMGDLQGAIGGIDHSGFIGATYKEYPFPAAQEDFKQSPDGKANRARFEELINPFGTPVEIPLAQEEDKGISVGTYMFSPKAFLQLVAYVDQGGYPRWKDEIRPDYVKEMMDALKGLSP